MYGIIDPNSEDSSPEEIGKYFQIQRCFSYNVFRNAIITASAFPTVLARINISEQTLSNGGLEGGLYVQETWKKFKAFINLLEVLQDLQGLVTKYFLLGKANCFTSFYPHWGNPENDT